MLVAVRRREILATVKDKKTVRVSDLSDKFHVTEETIRRDLEKLESEGKLLRTHGGAMSLEGEQGDLPHVQREIIHKKEKTEIGREAVKHIEENDIIFLDASSTIQCVARYLPNIPLTVLTNSIPICVELAKHSNIRLICTGGTFMESSMSFVGPLTLKTIEQYHVKKSFFSCKGIHLDWGISDSNELQALVKSKIMERSEEKFLLFDHSKLEKKAFATIGKIADVDTMIVDSLADDALLKMYADQGVKVMKARR
ncbi:DeoR/GlpR family DNA-binding transcription regulator [Bacillus sp. FJAT-50079]|uniref:DeoR/GlpR family DNA-binding transcription regulator n=1 Tax=Bacillus sp. FJAT-50079 TaxID=2833577 RepID=UPI001BC9768B|nr:DeoR/GlpR family DNA-binding transcription regulator [Bacillus sp. FJAT-50079]MBS4207979.1 DeoR/GlpR transcriptional regulator [Bacillus sp. FJAT-50079]